MKKLILAIETSCDETAMSLIRAEQKLDGWDFEILSNVVASQIDIHKKWGGVWPELASRAHLEVMIPVIEEALSPIKIILKTKDQRSNQVQNSNFKIDKSKFNQNSQLETLNSINAIAVTQGPGLIGSLLMGTETANILSAIYNKPIIPVNHLEGHIYAAFAAKSQKSKVKSQNLGVAPQASDDFCSFKIPLAGIFPILALVVSGGHTSLILMKDHLKYEVVGQTIDDAAGEAFDKVAKIMDLGYPGGPQIEKLARSGNENKYKLPIGLSGKIDFSFSGLKTAVLYLTKDPKTQKALKYKKADLAASFQKTVVDTLILKTQKAIDRFKPKTVILSGGVSANAYLRERFVDECCHPEFISGSKEKMPKQVPRDIQILIPPKELSTDNAVGIGICAALKENSTNYVEADPNLKLTQSSS